MDVERREDVADEMPAVRGGDRAFRPAADSWYNACVNWDPGNWDLYAGGNRKGADHLVDCVLATHSSPDTMVYPIVFLYRQYLELRLKDIWEEGGRLLGKPSRPPLEHRLDVIWNSVRPIIDEVFDGDDSGGIEALTKLLLEFREIDPKADGFRYPFDASGNPSLPGTERVNLRHLSEVVDRIADFLDGVSMAISVYLDRKLEMERNACW